MAYGELLPPPGSAIDRWDTTNKLLEGLSTNLSKIVDTQFSGFNVSWDRVQSLIRNGVAAKYLKVGNHLSIPYSYKDKTYTCVLDVWHHFDGSDDNHPKVEYRNNNGELVTGRGMVLGSHYAFPRNIIVNSKEAFFVPSVSMPAGTYNFTVNVTQSWGQSSGPFYSTGSTTYQFTTKTSIENKNYQFVWNTTGFTKISSVDIYSSWNSETPIETCDVTVGTGGTALGTISEIPATSSGHGYFNSIQRACEGSNNWEYSSVRSWLNSTAKCWHHTDIQYQDPKYIRFYRFNGALEDLPGFLSGFDDSFINSISEKKITTIPHPIDTNNQYGTSTTYDFVWPISAREHNFSNYLGNTEDGYKAEGAVFDYWKQLFLDPSYEKTQWDAFSESNPNMYGELRTHSLSDHTEPCDVFLRSANRSVTGSGDLGAVASIGGVYHAGAESWYRVQPAFLIVASNGSEEITPKIIQ